VISDQWAEVGEIAVHWRLITRSGSLTTE
jgi:hypothetical protein